MERKREYYLTVGLFIVYLVKLTWSILFKLNWNLLQLDHWRSINFIPFSASLAVNGRLEITEIINNALVFLPFGVYLSMLRPKWSWLQITAVCFCTSLCFEMLQLILALGASDITDIITNTSGGILGIALYRCMKKLWKDKTQKIVNGLFCIATVLLAGFLLILVLANL